MFDVDVILCLEWKNLRNVTMLVILKTAWKYIRSNQKYERYFYWWMIKNTCIRRIYYTVNVIPTVVFFLVTLIVSYCLLDFKVDYE